MIFFSLFFYLCPICLFFLRWQLLRFSPFMGCEVVRICVKGHLIHSALIQDGWCRGIRFRVFYKLLRTITPHKEDDGHTGCTPHAPRTSERVFAPSECDTCSPRLQIVLDPPRSTLPEYKLLKERFSNAAKSSFTGVYVTFNRVYRWRPSDTKNLRKGGSILSSQSARVPLRPALWLHGIRGLVVGWGTPKL